MSTGYGRLAACRDCGDPIRFVRLNTGSLLPINPKPREDGTGNVAARADDGRLTGFVISRDRRADPIYPLRFMPHHATCEARQPREPAPVADTPLF